MDNKEERVANAESLSDSSVLILKHLDKLNSLDSVNEIISIIEYSPVAMYKAIFEDVRDFYKSEGRFPDSVYLESKYPYKYYEPPCGQYSPDLIIDYLHQLRTHKKLKDIDKALSNFDIDAITNIVTKDVRVAKGDSDITIDNIFDIYTKLENSPRGMKLGIPELDIYTHGLDYGTLNVIAAPVSTFKCVSGNTRVHTSLGYNLINATPHGELDEEGFAPCNILARGKERVSDFYYGGYKNTLKISSPFFSLEGTPIHRVKVLTHKGIMWKQLQDIEKGDSICLDKKKDILFNNVTPKPKSLSQLSELNYGWIMGALYGDGYRTHKTIGFVGTLDNVDIFNNISGLNWKLSKDKRRNDTYVIRGLGNDIVEQFESIGFQGKATTKEIPEWIFSSNEDFIIGFLSGLVDTDGHVDTDEFNINLKSKNLIYGVRDLFNLLGIYPKIKKINFNYKYKNEVREEYIYRLTVLKQDALDLSILKLKTCKSEGLTRFLNSLGGKNTDCSIPYNELWKAEVLHLVDTKLKTRKGWYSYYKTIRGNLWVYEAIKSNKDIISKLSFNKFITLFDYEDYKDTSFYKELSEYNFKKVTSIEEGYSEVYDLSIPTTMTFTANGLINHNTTMAISTAYHACFNEGKNVIYITLEVTPAKVFFDLIARHAYEMGVKLSASSLKKATLNEQQKTDLQAVIDDWKKNCKGQIRIIGTSEIAEYTPAYLEAYIQKKKEEMGGLDMVYIDYLNLLKNKIPPQLKLDQYQALNFYTQFFTDMSIRMNFILMMLCQISREGTVKLDNQATKEGGKKLASTTFFAEANEVERSASVAFILHATRAMKNRNSVDIFLVKNRDGACPEEPINCPVVPEYFLVGTKDFGDMSTTDVLINDVITNPDYSVDDETLKSQIASISFPDLGEDSDSNSIDSFFEEDSND